MGATEGGNAGANGRRRKKDRKQRDDEVFIVSLLSKFRASKVKSRRLSLK